MDDLSGLEWSAKPNGSQPRPEAMGPSYASLRPTPSPFGSGRSTPLSAQPSSGSGPKPPPANAAHDSFSGLMNFGPAKTTQNLSLAERQAQLEEERKAKEEERQKQTEAQFGSGQAWDALATRQWTPSPSLQPPAASNSGGGNDDDLFAAFNKDTKVDNSSFYPPPESQRSTPANAAPLDLRNPNAWGGSASTTNGGGGLAAEDDDPFGLSEFKTNAAATANKQEAEDDDFLGDLGRPVDEVRKKQQVSEPEPGKPIEGNDSSSSDDEEPPARKPARQPERQQVDRRPKANKDPFDLAVSQLVAYGFSPEDARRGLVESGTGFNAQAAANWLLDDAHRKSKAAAQRKGSPASAGNSSRPPGGQRDSRSPAKGEPDLAKSAAAVGNSLFKTANSLWKTGQKRVQQAVSDFQQEADPNQPKWMRDAQPERSQGPPRADAKATDEALMLESGGRPQAVRSNSRQAAEKRPAPGPARGPSPAQSSSSRSSPAPRWQQQSGPPPQQGPKSRTNRLVADDDAFATYSSPNRRRRAAPSAESTRPEPKKPDPEPDLLFNTEAPTPTQTLPQRPAQKPAPSPRPQPAKRQTSSPRPAPRPARRIPQISPDVVQASTQHRLAGTAHYKRGDFAAAHESYSSSLFGIPDQHPLLIIVLTNRAMTALKTGEPKQAVTDADSALKLIGPGNGQGETVAVKAENGQEEQRDMKELYGKALSRKAEALEQMEKWADASAVWQQCVEAGVGGATAVKGRQRCQAALAPKPKPAAKPAVKPRPKPSATASLAPQKSSEAVMRLREANQAAAREDDEKFALSEQVDARVSAWRDGKRDNLRALLSSMDKVLWEGSGWKAVGLHELVMANKVKITYMKAIAKTHPDKLPQEANTEVRLIAGLVFHTLNESWEKFKTENGL